ncbi:MAG: DNA polymerase III subunit epsilon [OCS116 cluster bacterium]|uniref:DNA polymerase III subunit epsilon n=1 Tax=OCS116 cluster bacterium TaxID=2030921 RepID=A0A2A4YSE6_9PROT|nr:DNA polymerase III subunit epsilon [OCS116 cluster bacterium]
MAIEIPQRSIVLDTETTGFKTSEGHRLVEIGCLELHNLIPTGKEFHVYINPERDMPEGAFKVHGLSIEFLSDKPLFAQVADDFLRFCGDDILVIHNAPFDMGFLNFELQKVGKPKLKQSTANGGVIDTLTVARKRYPTGPNSLDALCRRFGIDNSNRTLHGALLDSELLAEVYMELMGGRQINLMDDEIGGAGDAYRAVKQMPRPTKLKSLLTEDELAAHKKFIDDEIGEKSLWHQI